MTITTSPQRAQVEQQSTSPAFHQPIQQEPQIAVLDITIPVFNEELDLAACVQRLYGHLTEHFPYSFMITIADNASTDDTLEIAEQLARENAQVRVVHLAEKGRGNALRTVWEASLSPVLAYMDVDLSTDLNALAPLVAPLISGHSDLSIGSRLSRGSRVVRGPKREIISRCYNLMLRGFLQTGFSDAQCGFKAIRADVAHLLLPHTSDPAWFFDTELLVLAERCGLRVYEVPVDWTDDPLSKVDIAATAWADLRGMARISRELVNGRIPVQQLRAAVARAPLPEADSVAAKRGLFGQLVRFGIVGVASTGLYLVLFLLFRLAMDAQLSNAFALLLSAVVNTAVNRSFTFGHRGSGAVRHQFHGLLVFGIGWALSAGSLWAVHQLSQPSLLIEIFAVVLANLLATLVKFLLFRLWVFRERPSQETSTTAKEA
ncbi:bifunctional glycosyltransferase family 2/GtrA family protein [Psychromicrobium lacuslunae]|uniref:bifunctional glycosyltransferase family 2/GtrA family protein n=1 Tax=Psychromicrobium lacuslunae TaxID=1618207 RepID=UPI0009E3AA39|nr:bifunctional glycosyltransferase family 2/GtrA family protein [Psychromicrobium lacuslunae]